MSVNEALIADFLSSWKAEDDTPDIFKYLKDHVEESLETRLQLVLSDQEKRWFANQPVAVDDYFDALPEAAENKSLRLQILTSEFRLREQSPHADADIENFLAQWPRLANELREILSSSDSLDDDTVATVAAGEADTEDPETSDHAAAVRTVLNEVEIEETIAADGVVVPDETADVTVIQSVAEANPTHISQGEFETDYETVGDEFKSIGRYEVRKMLGEGAFGRVFLGFDVELQREVAIKVPHGRRQIRRDDYLREARNVARLDHPAIVPAYDFGYMDIGTCFFVSKYIAGADLAKAIEAEPLDFDSVADLTATIADALHHAHERGLVHRDIKPANILLDHESRPHITDFGLALTDEDYGKGVRLAGTPAYMSPEQARGEGHLVDRRSDAFSLGVVFYELLTGVQSFRGSSGRDSLDRVKTLDVPPPRSINASIPRELQRICIKALAKRASDRYQTTAEMRDDLLACLESRRAKQEAMSPDGPTLSMLEDNQSIVIRNEVRIVPKGLRSFDAYDSEFFLHLLPGPLDRDGLPESVRFWKKHFDETQSAKTFRVGVLYGPSGCGKSSLMRAGVLPRVAEHVKSVYFEATPNDTEATLLDHLRMCCPKISRKSNLVDAMTEIRRGKILDPGQKIVVFIDQFEQWLHASSHKEQSELASAIRQCDGQHLQVVLSVRDDFWLGINRFMRDLEIPIVEGHNSALVDLFDLEHAEKVLIEFGRAFGKLPDAVQGLTVQQETFVKQAVASLASDEKVISIQLSLFAEMVKEKEWNVSTLEQLGGLEGVAVTFLEAQFGDNSKSSRLAQHQEAARKVLKALLPNHGGSIKGNSRPITELREIAGYEHNPSAFDELIHILDSEMRMLTPIDESDADQAANKAFEKRYQLAHDYLVPSLRSWLSEKQRSTLKGRAEICLADRASLWGKNQEKKQLPTLLEYTQIKILTKEDRWDRPERLMMKAAKRFHRTWCTRTILLAAVIVGAFYVFDRISYTERLIDSIPQTRLADFDGRVRQLENVRRFAVPRLSDRYSKSVGRGKLYYAIALAHFSKRNAELSGYLERELYEASPELVMVIRKALERNDVIGPLVEGTLQMDASVNRTLSSAAVMASVDAKRSQYNKFSWNQHSEKIVRRLVSADPGVIRGWITALEDVAAQGFLTDELNAVFYDEYATPRERHMAALALSIYFSNSTDKLVNWLLDSDEAQFKTIFRQLQKLEASSFQDDLVTQLSLPAPRASLTAEEFKQLGEIQINQQANAAIALLLLRQSDKVWPLFKRSSDPSLRTELIYRLHRYDVSAGMLVAKLTEENVDSDIRAALIQALANYPRSAAPKQRSQHLFMKQMPKWYNSVDDAELHVGIKTLYEVWIQEDEKNDDFFRLNLRRDNPRFVYSPQDQEMVIVEPDGPFTMGAPEHDLDRSFNESEKEVTLDHKYAVATTEVTFTQFREFLKAHPDKRFGRDDPPKDDATITQHPRDMINWYEAIAFCRWLSEVEKVAETQMCYPPLDQIGPEMKLPENWQQRTGYRLPTEAEWEFACRAGTTSFRGYSNTDSATDEYSWGAINSYKFVGLDIVGMLKPNFFGLRDMHGGVWELCQDVYQEDLSAANVTTETDRRTIRGGSKSNLPRDLRSSLRASARRKDRSTNIGFRIVRTIAD